MVTDGTGQIEHLFSKTLICITKIIPCTPISYMSLLCKGMFIKITQPHFDGLSPQVEGLQLNAMCMCFLLLPSSP